MEDLRTVEGTWRERKKVKTKALFWAGSKRKVGRACSGGGFGEWVRLSETLFLDQLGKCLIINGNTVSQKVA